MFDEDLFVFHRLPADVFSSGRHGRLGNTAFFRQTADKGDLAASWRLGGRGLTARGDSVLWGYFYADPDLVGWGSPENPDLFVKVWHNVNGPVYIDFFHASVPDIYVYSGFSAETPSSESGITSLNNRLVEHRFNN